MVEMEELVAAHRTSQKAAMSLQGQLSKLQQEHVALGNHAHALQLQLDARPSMQAWRALKARVQQLEDTLACAVPAKVYTHRSLIMDPLTITLIDLGWHPQQ